MIRGVRVYFLDLPAGRDDKILWADQPACPCEGHQTFSLSCAFMRIVLWWPFCGTLIVCFQRGCGRIAPDKQLQSPEAMALHTKSTVGSCAGAWSTSWAVGAAGMAALAMLLAIFAVSMVSWFSGRSRSSRLKVSAWLSAPGMCLISLWNCLR